MRINILTSFRNYILTRIVKTYARCWRVSTVYGDVLGFTSHTRDITFEGVTYVSVHGLTASDTRFTDSLATDTLSVQAFLSQAEEQDIDAGRYDHAQVEMFLVNYQDLTMSKTIEKVGTLGEIPRSEGVADFELRGLAQNLDTKIGRTLNILCDWELGGLECGVQLYLVEFATDVEVNAHPTNTIVRTDDGSFISDGYIVGRDLTISESSAGNNGTFEITNVAANALTVDGPLSDETATLILLQSNPFYLTSTVAGIVRQHERITMAATATDDYFTRGVLRFLTGNNADLARDIRVQRGSAIEFLLPFPYDFQVGDAFEMTAGCMKDIKTCREKFSNHLNHGGFPHTPVDENVFSSPIVSPSTVE